MARFTTIGGSGDGTPGAPGATGPQGPAGENGTNGADFGIYYLGNYISTNGYITDIAVVRGSDGQLYLAKASGQLGDPINYQSNGQWEVWIPKGADGADGLDGADGTTPFTLIGAYDNGVSYNLGVAVYYNGGTYVRTGNPLNPGYPPEPGTINASWTPIADKGDAGAQGEPGLDGDPLDFLNVASNIVPTQSNFYTLGTTDHRWADVYLGPNTINIIDQSLGTNATMGIDNGIFFINGIAQAQLPNLEVANLTFSDNTLQTTAAVPQVNADWNSTSGLSEILNKPELLQGEQGIQGPQGVQGPAGNSFTVLGSYANLTAFNAGAGSSAGTLGDAYILLSDGSLMVYGPSGWFDSGDLQGPQGIQGPQGLKGDKGDTGLTGLKGDKGDTGLTGPKGDTGAQGPQGVKGDTGDTGPAGLAGVVTSYASTLSSTNLAYSGTPTTARYIPNGKMINVSIDVNLATVTNFGQNGIQYFLTLPVNAAYDGFLFGQCTIAGTIYEIGGKVTAGSNSIGVMYCLSNGSGTPNTWEPLTKQHPANMTTSTTFRLNGMYISQ